MKKNIFYGAVISYNVIKQFYWDDKSFDHFVFQQMMDDGNMENDHYKLVFYAIDKDGCILNNYKPLAIKKINKRKHTLTKNVFFANIVLHRKHLDILYAKPTSNSELKLYPTRYNDTDYVSYIAETINSPVVAVTLDPSPPAKPY